MSTAKRDSFFTVALVAVAVLALTAGFFATRTAEAQDTHTAFNCDAATVALVFSAMDAYGYQPSFDLTGMGSASADQKPDFSRVFPSLQGEPATTPDPSSGNDTTAASGNDTTTGGTGSGVTGGGATQTFNANCAALRAEATNFVFGQLGMRVGGTTGGQTTGAIGPQGQGDNVFFVQLSGPQEVPGPGDADAIGEGSVTIDVDAGTVCWTYNVAGIGFPTAAHIHVGAEGESGSVVVPLSVTDGSFPSSGCTPAGADVIDAIVANPIGYYLNVHTDEFPAGALRGQLLDS